MNYKTVSRSLESTADAAIGFCRDRFGIKKCVIEQPIQRDVAYQTTLHGVTRDHHYLCVEVSENSYSDPLDAFVLECKNKVLPVKLYVAIPKGVSDSRFKVNFQRAAHNGVGLIELDADSVEIHREALSLSLTGVRPPEFRSFPERFRANLHSAHETFLQGNPAKGSSLLYDEVEAITRRLSKRFGGPHKANVSWTSVVEYLVAHVNTVRAQCPDVNKPMLSRILGLTDYRNEAGHKLTAIKDLMKRDRALRTRFEHATDTLSEVVQATKRLRL